MMTADLLAIGAHPDDVELACGGLLIQMAKWYTIAVLDLTRGELGSRGTPEVRLREARHAASLIGVHERHNAGLPDGGLAFSTSAQAILVDYIRKIRPRAVVVPVDRGRHPDHRAAVELVRSAIFAAGLPRFPADGAPFRPERLLYACLDHTITPHFFVDISPDLAQKRRAILAYRSQFSARTTGGSNAERFIQPGLSERLSSFYGSQCGVLHAEAYRIEGALVVADPLSFARVHEA